MQKQVFRGLSVIALLVMVLAACTTPTAAPTLPLRRLLLRLQSRPRLRPLLLKAALLLLEPTGAPARRLSSSPAEQQVAVSSR